MIGRSLRVLQSKHLDMMHTLGYHLITLSGDDEFTVKEDATKVRHQDSIC